MLESRPILKDASAIPIPLKGPVVEENRGFRAPVIVILELIAGECECLILKTAPGATATAVIITIITTVSPRHQIFGNPHCPCVSIVVL
jgi:hypothetical protein